MNESSENILIACDSDRRTISMIELGIAENYSDLSNHELANWIFNYYCYKIQLHRYLVVKFANTVMLPHLKQSTDPIDTTLPEVLLRRVQYHDIDLLAGNECVATNALITAEQDAPMLFKLTKDVAANFTLVENKHKVQAHHPESWSVFKNGSYDCSKEALATKYSPVESKLVIYEMLCDWMANDYAAKHCKPTIPYMGVKKELSWVFSPMDYDDENLDSFVRDNSLAACSSLEEFFVNDADILAAVKRAKRTFTIEEFKKQLQPGDLLVVYRDQTKANFISRVIAKASEYLQHCSFSSIKIVGRDSKYIYGYGSQLNAAGLKQESIDVFLSTLSGGLALRYKKPISEIKLNRLFTWIEDRLDRCAYDVLGLLKSIVTHITDIAENIELNKQELKSYYKPMICSSVLALAFKFIGLVVHSKHKNIQTIWPMDFIVSEDFIPIASFFTKTENADKVLNSIPSKLVAMLTRFDATNNKYKWDNSIKEAMIIPALAKNNTSVFSDIPEELKLPNMPTFMWGQRDSTGVNNLSSLEGLDLKNSWGEFDPFLVHANIDTGSTEAIKDISSKRKKILDYICKLCDIMEPTKVNSTRYRNLLSKMSDKDFDGFMKLMKEGKFQLHIVAPNLKINLQNDNLIKAAESIGCKLMHKIWMKDATTGKTYLTPNEYLVLNLPVRRQQQFLDEKLSVPDDDKSIDGLTGQVTGDSRSCSITNPEIQILAARGLTSTLQELVNVRGGNIPAYQHLKKDLEEMGEASLHTVSQGTKTRVSVTTKVILQSMMIDTNM